MEKDIKEQKKDIDLSDLEDIASTKEIKKLNKKADKYSVPLDVLRYNPEIERGLNIEQVESRHKVGLTNQVKKKYSKTYLEIFISNIFTFFNILLIIIGVALAIVGQWTNLFFLVILFANTAIGIGQEIRAKHIIDRLRLVTSPTAILVRNGQEIEVSTDEVVLDDIIVLKSGKQICTDAIVKEGMIEVNESLLTGESVPVKKRVGDTVLAGSFVVSGSCYARVDHVGEDNYVSRIQEKAKEVKGRNSELLNSLNRVIKVISFIIIPFAIITIVNVLLTTNLSDPMEIAKEVITTTAGSSVAMIPSGLFLLTSTTLTVSFIVLANRKASVQELYSIEMLARTDTLCLDKTGTITDGTMEVTEEIIIDKEIASKELETLMGSVLTSFYEKNQTSIALETKYPLNKTYRKTEVIPFSSERKLSAVTFKDQGTYILGAPEFILDNSEFGELLASFFQYTSKGYRVILLAHSDKDIENDEVPQATKAVAAFVLKDHIREEAIPTIKWFNENNVTIKIISGDNPITVAEIAKQVGVQNAEKCISLEGLSLQEVARIANEYTVFGRVSPEQKATLIKAMRADKHTVAMTGDGVNDILAMKQADCSIGMASGSEAVRNVAHIVLMDSNFASMPKVVEEGRKVINNIQNSACLFLMKTIFAVIMTLVPVIVTLCGTPLNYPFEPRNLYIMEFAVIGVPSFFLALQPNKNLIKGNFLKNVLLKAVPGGVALLSSVFIIMICKNFDGFEITTNVMMVTLAGYALSFTGLMVLFSICSPFNLYRLVLFAAMCVIAFMIGFVLPTSLTGLDYHVFNTTNWLLLIVAVFVSTAIYNLLDQIRLALVK